MAGLAGKGTSLWVGDGASPEVFTKIGKVKSISGPNFSVQFVDSTTHDTTGNFKETAAVLCEAGDLSFATNYDPSDPTLAPATGLYDAMQNLERKNYQLRFPPSDAAETQMSFAAYVASHPMSFPVDGIVEANISLKIDGAISWGTYGD
jgi:hypothetical protein